MCQPAAEICKLFIGNPDHSRQSRLSKSSLGGVRAKIEAGVPIGGGGAVSAAQRINRGGRKCIGALDGAIKPHQLLKQWARNGVFGKAIGVASWRLALA